MTDNILSLIGRTPLLRLKNTEKELDLDSGIFAKLEKYNAFGSVKDRAALYMINEAEKSGVLKPDSVIIEPTSGNTGIALAAVGKVKGYKVVLTMPESMSIERRQLLEAHGAELVLTEAALGMKGAIQKAEELSADRRGSVILSQFTNPANVTAHFETTGPEIYGSMNGNIDIFVATVGTGGTLTGVAKYLKQKNKSIRVIAVEPDESPVISGGKAGPHKIQGIGAGFVPSILDLGLIDEVIKINSQDAFIAVKDLFLRDGVLAGISSGAAYAAAVETAKQNKGKNIAVVFPDGGEKYLSTGVFDQ